MPETSVIETELVEAAGFEPTRDYERQDYLAALARAVNEVEEATFDNLSVEAQDWFNSAVKALNKKQDLPEFPDADDEAEAEEETPEAEEEETPAPKAAKAKKGNAKAKPEEEKAEAEATSPAPKRRVAPRKIPHPPVGELDHYGCNVNSKGHAALMMFETGCRMTDVTESVGGTYYNLLQKIVKHGHKLEKGANGFMKLTHKDKGKVR